MALLDFLPLFQETTASIRARIDADANAGIDPTDPAFLDTTQGGIYYDITQPVVLELERLWDAVATEYPAAAFPGFAWGPYLDQWGVTLNLPRKDAVKATGVVTFTGSPGTLIGTGTQVGTVQTDPDVSPPSFVTTESGTIPGGGSIDLDVEAAVGGSLGNVAPGTITILISPVTPSGGVSAITNADSTSGGAEVETDDDYRTRILLQLSQPAGAGNVTDYERWALAYPGVGHVSVTPIWAGPGTVHVIITDANSQPVAGAVVTGLQNELDPIAGEGEGLAPIGATVTVDTPTLVTVNLSATVVHEPGYSLDGGSGTVATRADIEAAIEDYFKTLSAGDDVYIRHVEARFFAVTGVLDVTSLLLNGAGTNVTITALQQASFGTATLV